MGILGNGKMSLLGGRGMDPRIREDNGRGKGHSPHIPSSRGQAMREGDGRGRVGHGGR